jgi:hypothetical protein
LLCCDQITDQGLQYLSALPLQHLNLAGCQQITNQGLQYLSALQLQYLDLADCDQITNQCSQDKKHDLNEIFVNSLINAIYLVYFWEFGGIKSV